MTKHEAICTLSLMATELVGELAGTDSDESNAKLLKRYIDSVNMAISALRQQERFGETNKSLTLDELSKRNDPVFLPIKDFPNGGYWCLCENGYIIPPSGHGFMAKERPNWVFYSQKPEEGTV